METYITWRSYMQNIAQQNKLIADGNATNQKKFYDSTLETFLRATVNDLPAQSEGPFMWWINYTRSIQRNNQNPISQDDRQFMFFIMQGIKRGDEAQEIEAKDKCELAVNQLLAKFKKDSLEKAYGNIWNHSFDVVSGVRIVPYEIRSNITYVGFQVSIQNKQNFVWCYDNNDWL